MALVAPASVQAAGPIELISGGGNGASAACDLTIQCLDFEASEDGSRAYFSTTERLAATDTDASKDVYLHTVAGTTQISTGLPGGNGNFDVTLQEISSDGSRVLFATFEALTRDDLDLTTDVYERSTEVRLLSTGAASGSLQLDTCDAETLSALACLGLAGAASGTPVYFTTPESLTFDDLDAGCVPAPEHCLDVYRRSGQTTTLVSAGTTGADGAQLRAVSRDGARAFFTTQAPLSPADTDPALDLYQTSGGAVTLVSGGPGAVDEDVVDDVRTSANGTHAVFATAERLTGADTDSAVDLYERAGGATTLVSAAPGTGNGPHDACVRFQGCAGLTVSANGALVVFETADALTPADTDTAVDVYERSGGAVRLVSEGGGGGAPAYLDAASADGAHVIFSTADRLVADDTDGAVDVYERTGSTTTRVSRGMQNGNGSAPAAAEGVSADGSRVVFSTAEALVPEDTDTAADLYARAAGVTELVSGGTADVPAVFLDMSWDAGRVFFRTAERLAAADTDSQVDVYAVGSSSAPPPVEEPPVEEPPVEEPPAEQPPGTQPSGTGGAARAAIPPPAAAGQVTGNAVARVSAVFGSRVRASRTGAVALKVRCSGPAACRGRIALDPASRAARLGRLGTKRFSASAGRTVSVRVQLSRRAMRALTRAGALKAKVRLQTFGDSDTVVSSVSRRLTVRAHK